MAVRISGKEPNYQLVCFDARHEEDSKHARTYIQDAEQHFQYQRVAQNPKQQVPDEERPCRISHLKQMEKSCRRDSDATHLTLFELSRWFCESLPCGPNASIKDMVEAARNSNPCMTEQTCLNFVGSLNAHQLHLHHLHEIQVQAARSVQVQAQAQVLSSSPTASSAPTSDSAAPPRAKKQHLGKELDGRKEVMKASTIEGKLDALLEVEKQCPVGASMAALNQSAKKWALTTMRPALRCFRNHHDANKASFSAAWKGKFKADFVKLCCKGAKGEACKGASGGA